MQKNILTLLAITTLLLSKVALADGGFYTGIGAGYANVNNTVQSPLTFSNGSSGSQSGGAVASTLYFGYDFNRFVGIQADYDIAFSTSMANSYSSSEQVFGGSVLLHLPFSIFSDALSGLSVYAKGGVGYAIAGFSGQSTCINCVNPPNTASAFAPLYGLGVEYGFTNVGYRLEWDGIGSIMSNNGGTSQVGVSSNLFLLSILYHF